MDDAALRALLERAAAWRDDDPDPRTRTALDDLVARAATPGSGSADARAELAVAA